MLSRPPNLFKSIPGAGAGWEWDTAAGHSHVQGKASGFIPQLGRAGGRTARLHSLGPTSTWSSVGAANFHPQLAWKSKSLKCGTLGSHLNKSNMTTTTSFCTCDCKVVFFSRRVVWKKKKHFLAPDTQSSSQRAGKLRHQWQSVSQYHVTEIATS